MNVNVNSQSRGARVNVPGGSTSTVHNSNQFNANSQSTSANSSSRNEPVSYGNSGSSNSSHVQNQTQNAPRANTPSRAHHHSSSHNVNTNAIISSGQNNTSVSPSGAPGGVNVHPAVRNNAQANAAVLQSHSTINTSGAQNGSTVSPQTPPTNPRINVSEDRNSATVNSASNAQNIAQGVSVKALNVSSNAPTMQKAPKGTPMNAPTVPSGSRNTTVPIVSVPINSAHIGSNHAGSVNNAVVSMQSASNSTIKGDSNVNDGDTISSTVVGSNTNTANTSHTHHDNSTLAAPAGINGSHVNITHSPNTSNIETIGGASSHNTTITTPQQRIDHTHKLGRYDPAAANRNGHRYYFTKATETTKEKRKGRGGSQRTDA